MPEHVHPYPPGLLDPRISSGYAVRAICYRQAQLFTLEFGRAPAANDPIFFENIKGRPRPYLHTIRTAIAVGDALLALGYPDTWDLPMHVFLSALVQDAIAP